MILASHLHMPSYCLKTFTECSMIDTLKRAAEPDDEICGTDAYRRWLKSVQG